jgi:glycosyltransferase involved in cell wall biosynthesis
VKILLTVEFYHPSIGGSQEVIRQIAEYLVRQGHKVTVATSAMKERAGSSINGVKVAAFELAGSQVNGYSGNPDEYRRFLLEGDFDIMMNYAAQNWSADLVFPLLGKLKYPAILAPCGFSMLGRPAYQGFFLKMPEIMRQYDHLIFHSERYQDIEYARELGIKHYSVIPNAAGNEFDVIDPTFRKKFGIGEKEPFLLTVGNHTGLKGHRLVIRSFIKSSIGKAFLVIIGDTSEGKCAGECRLLSIASPILTFGKKRILLMNPPRSEVVAAYHAADLFVFGSQVEASPLVLFEAMASRTPFITTACGNAEEIIEWGGSGVLLPTTRLENRLMHARVEDMTHTIEELWCDPPRREQMAQNGFRVWKERFTWEKVTAKYEKLFQKVAYGK